MKKVYEKNGKIVLNFGVVKLWSINIDSLNRNFVGR